LSASDVIPSGCQFLDTVFQGGIKVGEIVHIYGPSGVGKTTLALQYAINSARRNYRVLYIDAEKALSLIRLRQLAEGHFDRIAPKISIITPSNFDNQSLLMQKLHDELPSKTRLIIFDTIVSLYRKELGEFPENIQLNRNLNRQLGVLASISKEYPVSVILLNQVRGDDLNEVGFSPVANTIISYWCTKSIRLTKAESKGYRELKLVKGNLDEQNGFVVKLGLSGFK
jgi:RecA/RadA recombinase